MINFKMKKIQKKERFRINYNINDFNQNKNEAKAFYL